jgi:hypothetical protein
MRFELRASLTKEAPYYLNHTSIAFWSSYFGDGEILAWAGLKP